jgi:hypothetical protein
MMQNHPFCVLFAAMLQTTFVLDYSLKDFC